MFITAILALPLLTGCGGPQNNGYLMPQQINEPAISLLPPTFEPQTERINNCDGASPNYLVSYKTIESQNATFEVVVEAGGLVTGTPIPTALEIQLEAKIAASLSKQYGINIERNHELPLVIPTGKKVEHIITWKVTRIRGIIDVVYGDGTAQVAFNKIASIELYDRQSADLPCDENVAVVTQPQQNITAEPVVIVTTPPPTSGIAAQLDAIFGQDRWFCFPDRGDAVGIKKLASEVTIQSPLVKVDTYLGTYTSGKTPYGIGATVWLNTWVPQEECPASQAAGIAAWKSASLADSLSFGKSRMDTLFGTGNWQCVPNFDYAVKVGNLPTGTSIQYPFTAVDTSSGRYGVGETIPQSGAATVWLAGSIPQSDCP